MKFNSKQLLFEQFFYIIGNFGNLQHKNESTFPFHYNMIFERYLSFKPPSSTPEGDRNVRLLTFLYENQFSTTFIWTIFLYNWKFLQHSALKRTYFLIPMYDNILHDHLCDTQLPTFETLKFFRLWGKNITSMHK